MCQGNRRFFFSNCRILLGRRGAQDEAVAADWLKDWVAQSVNLIMVDKNKGLHGHLNADYDQLNSAFYHIGMYSSRIENYDTCTGILTVAVCGNVEEKTNK